jgi:hypothetical protein
MHFCLLNICVAQKYTQTTTTIHHTFVIDFRFETRDVVSGGYVAYSTKCMLCVCYNQTLCMQTSGKSCSRLPTHVTKAAPMNTLNEFEAHAKSIGYAQVLVKEWQPNLQLETHAHPFAVQAQVVAGELWLTAQGATQHLSAGSQFELAANVPHEERYGQAGATVWVARRYPADADAS